MISYPQVSGSKSVEFPEGVTVSISRIGENGSAAWVLIIEGEAGQVEAYKAVALCAIAELSSTIKPKVSPCEGC